LAGLRADFFAAGFFALFFFAAGFALPPSAASACGRVFDFGRDFKPPPTYSLNCLAGRKRGAFFAGRAAKWRISPVNGSLRSPALRAAVTFCLNLPKPVMLTSSPFLIASWITPSAFSQTCSTSRRLAFARSATEFRNFDLFRATAPPPVSTPAGTLGEGTPGVKEVGG